MFLYGRGWGVREVLAPPLEKRERMSSSVGVGGMMLMLLSSERRCLACLFGYSFVIQERERDYIFICLGKCFIMWYHCVMEYGVWALTAKQQHLKNTEMWKQTKCTSATFPMWISPSQYFFTFSLLRSFRSMPVQLYPVIINYGGATLAPSTLVEVWNCRHFSVTCPQNKHLNWNTSTVIHKQYFNVGADRKP